MKHSLLFSTVLFLSATVYSHAQTVIKLNRNSPVWKTIQDAASVGQNDTEHPAALCLKPGSHVRFNMTLKSSSTYQLTMWTRTESGADSLSVSVTGLGRNNISFSKLWNWIKKYAELMRKMALWEWRFEFQDIAVKITDSFVMPEYFGLSVFFNFLYS